MTRSLQLKLLGLGCAVVSLATLATTVAEDCWGQPELERPCCSPQQLTCGSPGLPWACNETTSGEIEVNLPLPASPSALGMLFPPFVPHGCTTNTYTCGTQFGQCIPQTTVTSECRDYQSWSPSDADCSGVPDGR